MDKRLTITTHEEQAKRDRNLHSRTSEELARSLEENRVDYMAARYEDKEMETMRCAVCGSELKVTRTDLPFKVRDASIVILKNLPVMQCGNCPEYMIEDAVLSRVDEILARVDSVAEVEIIRYAA